MNRYRAEEENENKVEETLNENKEEKEKINVEPDIIEEETEDNKSKKEKKKDKKLEEEIKKLQEQVKELNNKYLMNLAETENFRKRIEEEKIRDRKYASQRLLEKLINPIDIFDKACNMKTDNEVLKNFLIGFQMIDSQIHGVLEEEGVKKINCAGKFDPRYHNAVEVDYDETKDEGDILAVLKDGYMYKDRVLVPASVKVNKKPIEEAASDAEEENKEN